MFYYFAMPNPFHQGEEPGLEVSFHRQVMRTGAIRGLLQAAVDIKLTGPFLCYESTLYFSSPLSYDEGNLLVPLDWDENHHLYQVLDSDPHQPKPLVRASWNPKKPVRSDQNTNGKVFKYPEYLSYEVIKTYLERGTISSAEWRRSDKGQKLWKIETRPHNSLENGTRQVKDESGYFVENAIRLESGWGLAIGIEIIGMKSDNSNRDEIETELESIKLKLENLNSTVFRLGGEGHRALLERCDILGTQWSELKEISNKNRDEVLKQWQGTEETLKQSQEQKETVIAYLVTPGVFERRDKKTNIAECRAWPWEWKLTDHPNPTQTKGSLVSVATNRAVPISCRMGGFDRTSRVAPQVFAAPTGSVYYLEKPENLFQEDPNAPERIRRWRTLGYSELLWIKFIGE